MLQALGFDLAGSGRGSGTSWCSGLKDLAVISDSHALPELKECTFRIACDVTNPLCGSQGCSAVFGPQKGADPAMIQQMDQWLSSYAALAEKAFRKRIPRMQEPGLPAVLGLLFSPFSMPLWNPV